MADPMNPNLDVFITVDVMGEKQVRRAFADSAHKAQDLRVPLNQIGFDLVNIVSEQMVTEGAAGLGGKWADLNPAYAEWKRQQVGEQPILVFTGYMRHALTDRATALTVQMTRLIYRPTGKHAELAAYHQEGGGFLPQRKIVALTESQKHRWMQIFVEWFQVGFYDAWGGKAKIA